MKKFHKTGDGRIVGPGYGDLYDLVSRLCNLLGFRLAKLDIVVDPDVEIDPTKFDFLDKVVKRDVEKAPHSKLKSVRLSEDAWLMLTLLLSYYGAIQEETPSKMWVASEAIRFLFVQNRNSIEKLVQVAMEVRSRER